MDLSNICALCRTFQRSVSYGLCCVEICVPRSGHIAANMPLFVPCCDECLLCYSMRVAYHVMFEYMFSCVSYFGMCIEMCTSYISYCITGCVMLEYVVVYATLE